MAKLTAKQKAEQREFKLQNTSAGLHRKRCYCFRCNEKCRKSIESFNALIGVLFDEVKRTEDQMKHLAIKSPLFFLVGFLFFNLTNLLDIKVSQSKLHITQHQKYSFLKNNQLAAFLNLSYRHSYPLPFLSLHHTYSIDQNQQLYFYSSDTSQKFLLNISHIFYIVNPLISSATFF